MIGKNQIQITGTQFTQGLCTSDYLGDGGLGTSSTNLTLQATPGVIRATGSAAMSGSLPGVENIIAACEDPQSTTSSYNGVVVTDGGSFASIGGSTFNTFVRDGSNFTNFRAGVTDMVAFGGAAFATRTTDVAKWSTSGGVDTIDGSWWVTTNAKTALSGSARHPLLVFEGFMWIADANKLHSVDSSFTIALSVLTLNSNERIVSLGIDPFTGLMMIGVRTIYSTSDDLAGRNYVYLYDGYSSKARRKIVVDGTIWGSHPVGGQLYVGMNNTIGQWNGNGVTFLRRLANTPQGTNTLPNKMRLSSYQNTLLVVDNNNTVLAYGDVVGGRKAWIPLYYVTAGAKNINLIYNLGNDTSTSIPLSPWIMATGGSQVAVVIKPLDTTAIGTGVAYTSNVNFERPVNVRRMRVFTTGITTTAGIGDVSITDENGVEHKPTVHTFVVSSGTKYVFDFDFNQQLSTMQPKIQLDTQAFGLIRLIIYYDVVE
jgi:hypothetical protein